MKYDCIVIGGGLSGLTCGIKCVSEGLSCAVFSTGMSTLHYSSGSFDLFGYTAGRKIVRKPFEFISELINLNHNHPYSKCGIDNISNAINFFQDQLREESLILQNNEQYNHFHLTALGTLKPTYLSQQSVFNERIKDAYSKKGRIAVLNFEGFRDFYSDLAISNLKKHKLLKSFEIISDTIELPIFKKSSRNPHEFRSIDIARVFDSEKYLQKIASRVREAVGDVLFICFPAFIGIRNYNKIFKRLEELTGSVIIEIPTLPPSILGMRVDNALKSRFASLGGVFISGDRVNGGEIINGQVDHIHTANHGNNRLQAEYYVLSSGSFLSGGLVSEYNSIKEPVLGLNVHSDNERTSWSSRDFFSGESHKFLEYGVITDGLLNPVTGGGNPVKNIFCTGSVLSGYNPIREGSGGGVAIATGYTAACRIIEGIKG